MDTSPVTTSKLDQPEIDWLIDMLKEVKEQASEATRERIKDTIINRNPLIRIALSIYKSIKKQKPEGDTSEESDEEKKFAELIKEIDDQVDEIFKDAQDSAEHSSRVLLKLQLLKSEV